MSSPILSQKFKRKSQTLYLRTPKRPSLEDAPLSQNNDNISNKLSANTDGNIFKEDNIYSAEISNTLYKSDDSVLCTSLNSITDEESQESQSLCRKLKEKVFKFSNNLYDLRRKKEEVLKSRVFDTPENSPPGLEKGPFCGLPSRVQELFKHYRGIRKLYDWQEECVKEGIKGENLVISFPTSGGKTLVAEILMLRQLLIFQKDVLVILPYVSLVQEKVRGLSPFAIDLEFLVEEYAGGKGLFPPKKRKKNVVYFATIEKANMLIESLIEQERLDSLGLVVVDEVHMLGDSGGRGARLEMALVKLKYVATCVQIVSMSATVGNVKEIASFLCARLYTGSFRPVPLTEYIKLNQNIAEINPKATTEDDLLLDMKDFSYSREAKLKQRDPDCITGLIDGVIPEHSCLIFCSTRQNAESVALMLRSTLPKQHATYRAKERKALINALKAENTQEAICHILQQTIPYGVAYHHSGLTEEERKLIEEGFQSNTLSCITCTSTLAAGVNLPARRVVIRSPYMGRDFLTRSKYQQMIGRAGRAGLDCKGESFIITTNSDLAKVAKLLLSPVENCMSRLGDNDMTGLSELVFSMLGLKVITDLKSAFSLVDCTLLGLQAEKMDLDIKEKVRSLIRHQFSKGFLRLHSSEELHNELRKDSIHKSIDDYLNGGNTDSSNKSVLISRLGKAAIKGGISLSLVSQLYDDLKTARSHLALHSYLHLLYLVTPYTMHDSLTFKPQVFFDVYMTFNSNELEVSSILGITEGVAVKLIQGAKPKLDASVLHRFYAALMLHEVIKGKSILRVSELFEIHRGTLQQLLLSASSFASSVYRFCQELDELWAFEELFGSFSRKLSGYCSVELVPLMELPSVKLGRARLLYRGGFKTLTDIANADAKQLVNSVDHLSYKVAYQIISSAKMILLQKADALQEEAESLLEGLGNDPESSFLSSFKMAS